MGEGLATKEMRRFLERFSALYPEPVHLYLAGGSALCFLGRPRRTVAIDCTADIKSKEFESAVEAVAQELQLEVEIVPDEPQ
jgi:hypothetical protein